MIHFFSRKEEKQIIAAIKEAEQNTSGEIRVHLSEDFEGDILTAASKTFHALNMDRTAENNGVLFFIVPSKHQFAIWGDTGINHKVPTNFWMDVRDVMQRHFQNNRFADGVCEGVKMAGQKLKEHFPRSTNDKNELSDEISYSGQKS